MSINIIAGTLNKYVVDNWVETPIQLRDATFVEPTSDEWISVAFTPTNRNLVGLDGTLTGRVENIGIFIVRCYAKYRLTALDLADKVNTLLDGKRLNNGIYTELGQPSDPIFIEGKFECTVTFRVSSC